MFIIIGAIGIIALFLFLYITLYPMLNFVFDSTNKKNIKKVNTAKKVDKW